MFSGLLVGILFGFLLQRGQFCFVSGFRNILWQKNLSFLSALFIAITLQSIGLFTLAEFQLITIPTTQLPLLATLLGGFVFGIGMVVANCCATGSWFRSAEGKLSSWIVLITFTITMAATQTGVMKDWFSPLLQQPLALDNMYLTFGISPWILVVFLTIITLILFYYGYQSSTHFPTQTTTVTSLWRRLFSRHWSLAITAILLGLLGIAAWWLSAQTGRNYGFGVSVPSANVLQFIVTGQQRYLNWGSCFVIGILLGSLFSAKSSGEFTWRELSGKDFIRRIIGGFLMGIGATLAGGCTVTNALVATAYFSWQGWLAMIMMILGCWFATLFFKPKH
ncbi:ABC transporter permease [Gallibacterium salpingitidis]|uniref:ABC transporter permease n=1 Tax=Gallibacterium salpingitidis TaxID=505341 RepID=A0AB36E138_9PAST|nr:YeeE/YedE family protein [Gallibacterium salpingitidis]OBX06454.1 ABC transporter permease [Gallibacterium salpingitidis]OBX08919.1 ABC transporter permease [Gallibacterium salpingitidis]